MISPRRKGIAGALALLGLFGAYENIQKFRDVLFWLGANMSHDIFRTALVTITCMVLLYDFFAPRLPFLKAHSVMKLFYGLISYAETMKRFEEVVIETSSGSSFTKDLVLIACASHMDCFLNYIRAGDFDMFYSPTKNGLFFKVSRFELSAMEDRLKAEYKGKSQEFYFKRSEVKDYLNRISSVGSDLLGISLSGKQ